MRRCPQCRHPGHEVKRVTLESLLRAPCRAAIGDGPYRVCTTPGCPTVYFGDAHDTTFVKSDLLVRFGLKETDAPRPVCYCFGHTIEDIHDEIRRTGRSTVLNDIKAAIKEFSCHCPDANPLGGCCLKSVQTIVAEGLRSGGRGRTAAGVGACDPQDCCAAPGDSPPRRAARSSVLEAGGSVLAAILSAACCWLPLLFIAFGASAAGVAGFFQAYRPYFVIAAVGLLAAGFYRVYFRAGACKPNAPCATTGRKLSLFNQAMLWTATAIVAAFLFFPNYAGYVFGPPGPGSAAVAENGLVSVPFHIEGMTCEGCAHALRSALSTIPGVKAAEVHVATKTAVVRYEPDQPVPAERVIEAVNAAGFSATPSAATP